MGASRKIQSVEQNEVFSLGFRSAAGQGKVLTRHVVMLSGSFAVVFVPSEFVTLNVSFTPVDPLAVNVVAVPPVPLNPDSRIVVIFEFALSTKRS